MDKHDNHPTKPPEQKKLIQKDGKYWRSLEEHNLAPDALVEVEPEFADSPIREGNEETDEGRREFLKLMAASAVMLSASACSRRPVEKIIPYVKHPEGITPGIANYYASTCGECSTGCGVIVKTREGRPIKLEGNSEHPLSQGGLCARGQASVLNLYDADRLRESFESSRKGAQNNSSWEQISEKITSKVKGIKAQSGKIVVLTGAVSGSTEKLIGEFVKGLGANASHVVYETLSGEETAIASKLSYGNRVVPSYDYEKANYILTFGADFLGTWNSSVEATKNFMKRRKLGVGGTGADMSKLVAFETAMTLTGSNSDERHPIKAGDEVRAALAVAAELIVTQGKTKYAGDAQVVAALKPHAGAKISDVSAAEIKNVALELWENKGKGIVLGGGHLTKGDQGVALDVVANLLNSALDNEGSTIDGTNQAIRESSSFEQFSQLTKELNDGKVKAVLIYKANPIYFAPKSMKFAEALQKAELVVNFNTAFDETAHVSDFVVATHHYMENWGDSNTQQGVVGIFQPTISPLYATRGFEDTLIEWSKNLSMGGKIASTANWYEYVKDSWKETHRESKSSAPFVGFWEDALKKGFHSEKKGVARARNFDKSSLSALTQVKPAAQGMSLVMYPKVSQGDGRIANNSWLQELSDPISKITWDNYAAVSVSYAKSANIEDGDVLKIKAGDHSIELPALVQPGTHAETVAIAVGYGRKGAGKIGDNVGVNILPFAVPGKQSMQTSAIAVSVEKTGAHVKMATTQKHHSIENRPIVKEATFKEYKKDRASGNKEKVHLVSLWPSHDYPGYRWGMAIDLNSCTGCGSCVIGCQAENNIPVVGKKNVIASREMHWIRIDRYYSGRADNPETTHQPMLCQHCENAPCETVCPVLATVHDHEGINQQVYNRCVGTRYCANNCPYKVRRFNWFTFTDVESPMQYVYNPDVTVRTRGVMEKCTFCIQRVREGKDRAKDQDRAVLDGEIKTACQQSCPGNAIVFGNINDKNSMVTKIGHEERSYHVLEDLNVRPSISYLTKIRNKEAT